MSNIDIVHETGFNGLKYITPRIFNDERGCFLETYKTGILENISFLQDNMSISKKYVFRGFHFQKQPYVQGKLVYVTRGSVLDIVLDIRKDSDTFGKFYSILLTDKNHVMLYVPEGFAHGFLSLADDTVFQYKCTNVFNKESEGAISVYDPEIQKKLKFITYENTTIADIINRYAIVSEKDKHNSSFAEAFGIF